MGSDADERCAGDVDASGAAGSHIGVGMDVRGSGGAVCVRDWGFLERAWNGRDSDFSEPAEGSTDLEFAQLGGDECELSASNGELEADE